MNPLRQRAVVGLGVALLASGCSTAVTTIRSNPSGARVLIDGTARGETPLSLKLRKQTHRIRIEKDGYISVNDHIPVIPSRARLVAFLLTWPFGDDIKYTLPDQIDFELVPADQSVP